MKALAAHAEKPIDLLRIPLSELAVPRIDTKTYLAVSHWRWVLRQLGDAK